MSCPVVAVLTNDTRGVAEREKRVLFSLGYCSMAAAASARVSL
jgi:hypothetical protein